MNQLGFPLLSLVVFFPLMGAILLLLIDRREESLIKGLAFVVSLIDFFLALPLYFAFRADFPEMQFVEKLDWVKEFGISYFMGIDGISLFLVLLTLFLSAISILSSWTAITERVKEYMICMLFLETGMLGVFVALDLFLFYIFWEGMLIPMYFLIGIWGGPQRIYAAVKFFLYTMAGSLLMLVAILALYFLAGLNTFDLLQLYGVSLPPETQWWLFLAFSVAFSIKVPLFPFHTWLPLAHVEAPTAGSVILAGVLLKMGTYGFLRFCLPLFPDASHTFVPLVAFLSIVGIIYGALVAMVQKDVKRLVAYSSVSHLGFVMLGIFAFNVQGIAGGILQMINHGLSTGALFLAVGMIYERRHTRMIEEFGGLSRQIPIFAIFFMIITLSSIGLPGLNGFIGEFLILVGVFNSHPFYATLAATGIILAAVYMLWMFQRVMFGELTNPANRLLKDLNAREIVVLVPLILFILWIGLYPKPLLEKMEPSVKKTISLVMQAKGQQALAPELRGSSWNQP